MSTSIDWSPKDSEYSMQEDRNYVPIEIGLDDMQTNSWEQLPKYNTSESWNPAIDPLIPKLASCSGK